MTDRVDHSHESVDRHVEADMFAMDGGCVLCLKAEVERLQKEVNEHESDWARVDKWEDELHTSLDELGVVSSAYGIPNVRDGYIARIKTTLEWLQQRIATLEGLLDRCRMTLASSDFEMRRQLVLEVDKALATPSPTWPPNPTPQTMGPFPEGEP